MTRCSRLLGCGLPNEWKHTDLSKRSHGKFVWIIVTFRHKTCFCLEVKWERHRLSVHHRTSTDIFTVFHSIWCTFLFNEFEEQKLYSPECTVHITTAHQMLIMYFFLCWDERGWDGGKLTRRTDQQIGFAQLFQREFRRHNESSITYARVSSFGKRFRKKFQEKRRKQKLRISRGRKSTPTDGEKRKVIAGNNIFLSSLPVCIPIFFSHLPLFLQPHEIPFERRDPLFVVLDKRRGRREDEEK